jgi:predicted ATP-dependent serine protease
MDIILYHFRSIILYFSIDQLLGGGIRCGEVTELFGPAGVGKTQAGHILLIYRDMNIYQNVDCV